MLKILFQDGASTDASFRLIKDGVVELVGDGVDNLSGFVVAKENGRIIGDYRNFTTKYNIYTDVANGIQLSNGEVEPEPIPEPEPPAPKTVAKVKFVSDGNCTLDGATEMEVAIGTDAGKLHAPRVGTDMRHEFIGWVPALEGEILDDMTFQANAALKEEYTLEARMAVVEGSIMEIAEIVYS